MQLSLNISSIVLLFSLLTNEIEVEVNENKDRLHFHIQILLIFFIPRKYFHFRKILCFGIKWNNAKGKDATYNPGISERRIIEIIIHFYIQFNFIFRKSFIKNIHFLLNTFGFAK